MTTTVIRFPKHIGSLWCRNAGGLSLEYTGDVVTIREDSYIFKFESKAKSLALLLFDTPATLTWSEQEKATLNALIAFVNKNGMSGVSVGLGRAVLKGQINPGDVIEQLRTNCDRQDPETKERVKGGGSILINPQSTEDMDRVLKFLHSHDYPIDLSVTVSKHSVPRTMKVVDMTSLSSLDLSSNKLVQGIENWDDFVLGKLSRLPNLQSLDLDKNGLGRTACDALATMLSRSDCNLRSLNLKYNKLDNGCVEVLALNLLHNFKLKTMELRKNDQITSHGEELLLRLLGKGRTPVQTCYSNYTLTSVNWDNIIANNNGSIKEGSAKILLEINHFCDSDYLAREKNRSVQRVYMERQKIWYVHYQRAKQFDVSPFLGLEVGVMPHLLAWFGVTKDKEWGTRFMETIFNKRTPFDSYQKRFNIFYQLVRNWNVATLLGHLSPDRAKVLELEGQVASMGEEIRSLKSEVARLQKENQELSSGNVTSKRKRVS